MRNCGFIDVSHTTHMLENFGELHIDLPLHLKPVMLVPNGPPQNCTRQEKTLVIRPEYRDPYCAKVSVSSRMHQHQH